MSRNQSEKLKLKKLKHFLSFFHFTSSIFHLPSFLILLTSYLFSQTHFTVPENVWRISVKPSVTRGSYIGPGGVKGIQNMSFNLANYGKRYFDHGYVVDGYYASENDLHNLDTLGLNSNYTVGEYIRYYNAIYNDSIPDLSTDFFGNDSITVGGSLDQEISKTSWGMDFKIEYGLSNRLTFEMNIPYFSYVSQNRTSKWTSNEIEGLDSFGEYHQGAMAAMDSALVSNYDINLQLIRNRFYDWEGSNSLRWAMGGDPFVNGIYGSEFNPFTTNDTTSVTMDDLLDYYYPSNRTASGLGDVELGLKILLLGNPAWSESGNFSLYTGLSVLLGSADRLHTYSYSSGIPVVQSHFKTLPLGDGVSRYNISLFGELFKTILRRQVNINWLVRSGFYSQTRVNSPISFVNFNTFNPDSIAVSIGVKHTIKKGNEVFAMAQGKLELIPDWVSVSGGASMYVKGRDTFYSNDPVWDKWMSYREDNYDTKKTVVRQFAEVAFHNVNPLKRIGPIPFELRGGVSIPIVTRNSYSNFSAWIQLVVYAQAW
ncbi:MAG: hypothetical protein H8E70_06470 [Candidatus Marinimicrobia bacterium]|nr:hypothetical protein [Candidatus Neomarinimicrobiota bacterium]